MPILTHAEVQELLGAFALDAVEPDEAGMVRVHVEGCPRCRDELSNHREVAGMLAYGGQEAPDGLWDRIVAGIHDGSPEELGAPLQFDQLRRSPALRGRRWSAPGGKLVGAVAAAAAAVVALLGVQVVRLQDRTDHLSGQIASIADQPTMKSVDLALAEPGARKVTLTSSPGGVRLDAVILPSGAGYLYGSTLSPLPPTETYQLWGVVGTERISYGLIGASPAQVTAFRAGSGVQALAVTEEVAGGVAQSARGPVVAGVVAGTAT